VNASLRDLLEWVERSPRGYDETMQAWASHCPRFTTWEDALAEDLVRVVRARVELTPSGQAALLDGRRPYSRQ
jgi:hypothetical protein